MVHPRQTWGSHECAETLPCLVSCCRLVAIFTAQSNRQTRECLTVGHTLPIARKVTGCGCNVPAMQLSRNEMANP